MTPIAVGSAPVSPLAPLASGNGVTLRNYPQGTTSAHFRFFDSMEPREENARVVVTEHTD